MGCGSSTSFPVKKKNQGPLEEQATHSIVDPVEVVGGGSFCFPAKEHLTKTASKYSFKGDSILQKKIIAPHGNSSGRNLFESSSTSSKHEPGVGFQKRSSLRGSFESDQNVVESCRRSLGIKSKDVVGNDMIVEVQKSRSPSFMKKFGDDNAQNNYRNSSEPLPPIKIGDDNPQSNRRQSTESLQHPLDDSMANCHQMTGRRHSTGKFGLGTPKSSGDLDQEINRQRRIRARVNGSEVSGESEGEPHKNTADKEEEDIPTSTDVENDGDSKERRNSVDVAPVQSLFNNKMVQAFKELRKLLDRPDPPRIIQLPRGGVYVKTSAGAVQVGMPPETIKDCLSLKLDLPMYYIVPRERFDRKAGLNIAEFEFPAYFNFFVRRKRVNLVCPEAEEAVIRSVFQETLFGPDEPNALLDKDFYSAEAKLSAPDLEKELSYFRINPFNPAVRMEVDDLINFIHLDRNGIARFTPEGQTTEIIIQQEPDEYVILERAEGVEEGNEKQVASVSDYIELPCQSYSAGLHWTPDMNFEVPLFGVTFLGTSHGFDPQGTTTGFVLWMNGRGIMVDPPPHSGALLRQEGIPPKMIDAIILTHCHADHDAGTFQKILMDTRVTVMTTKTIMSSFCRKYAALCKLDERLLRRLFAFQPVTIDETVRVHGGEIRFFYALHSVPCTGFEATFGGKKIIYSADTCFIPERIEAMHKEGILSAGRKNSLLNFNWDADLILHEAGVPPLHTPAAVLAKLPAEVRERMYCVHVGLNNFPFKDGLKIAACGIKHTVRVHVDKKFYKESIELIDMIGSIDIFRSLPIVKAREILQSFTRMDFSVGETIFKEGDTQRSFFIVERGICEVSVSDLPFKKKLFMGDYFGEMALLTDVARSATVTALSDVSCLQFERGTFFHIIYNTDVHFRLLHVVKMRGMSAGHTIEANRTLSLMADCQKTELMSIMEPNVYRKGEFVWARGEQAKIAILVQSGKFAFEGQQETPFARGAFLGEIDVLLDPSHGVFGELREFTMRAANPVHCTTLEALEDSEVYEIDRDDISQFLLYNPGILVNSLGTFFIE